MYAQRTLFFCGFLLCAAMVAAGIFYFQGVLGLEPCPLCIFQRLFIIAVGAVFLVAAIHNPGITGRRIYGLLAALVAGVGAGISGRHVWLQSLPPDAVPACGPGLDYLLEIHPTLEVVELVLRGSGECAEVHWALFGLSIPGWTFLGFAAFVVFGLMFVFSRVGLRPRPRNIFR